jgi:hypothetical protein
MTLAPKTSARHYANEIAANAAAMLARETFSKAARVVPYGMQYIVKVGDQYVSR